MRKIIVCFVFIVFGLILLTGCGNKLKDYAGIYKLEYSKFVGDSIDAKSVDEVAEIILNDDGTGKSNRDGLNIDVEWTMDGENITLIEVYMGIRLEYNGIIKNGRLDIFNGDKTNDLTVEKVYNKE